MLIRDFKHDIDYHLSEGYLEWMCRLFILYDKKTLHKRLELKKTLLAFCDTCNTKVTDNDIFTLASMFYKNNFSTHPCLESFYKIILPKLLPLSVSTEFQGLDASLLIELENDIFFKILSESVATITKPIERKQLSCEDLLANFNSIFHENIYISLMNLHAIIAPIGNQDSQVIQTALLNAFSKMLSGTGVKTDPSSVKSYSYISTLKHINDSKKPKEQTLYSIKIT